MAQKRKPDQTKLVTEAALSLAGKQGWDGLSLKNVAQKAKVSQKTVEGLYSDGWDILAAVLKQLEKDTTDAVSDYLSQNWRDNLMEILMMRFELAQKHRAAYAAIGPSVLRHPPVIQRFARPFYSTLGRLLQLAGLPKSRCQPLFIAGFGVVYISLVDTWLKDDSADLAKTMAAIDKRVGTLEQAYNTIKRN